MQTFKGDQELKDMLIAETIEHRKADELVQGIYFSGTKEKSRLCAVGCSIFTLNKKLGKDYDCSDHNVYETELGIPEQLAYLEDRIFEGLTKDEAVMWPEKFLSAINVGVDLSMAPSMFLVWLMDDISQFAKGFSDVLKAISTVKSLYERKIAGELITDKEWQDAAYAADAADAACAANAANAAYDAKYAAYAAYDAYDAYDAKKSQYKKMADKLIEILQSIK